jgi:hypothetical protein
LLHDNNRNEAKWRGDKDAIWTQAADSSRFRTIQDGPKDPPTGL